MAQKKDDDDRAADAKTADVKADDAKSADAKAGDAPPGAPKVPPREEVKNAAVNLRDRDEAAAERARYFHGIHELDPEAMPDPRVPRPADLGSGHTPPALVPTVPHAAADAPPKGKTKRVRIVRRFQLNRDDGTRSLFTPEGTNCGEPGTYEVSEADANHPYLQHHTDDPPPINPVANTRLAVEAAQRAAAQERVRAAVAQQEAEEERLNRQRVNALRTRAAYGDDSRQ